MNINRRRFSIYSFFNAFVIALLIILFIFWLCRYIAPTSTFVQASEQLFGSDTNMHASFGFLLTLSIGWLLRLWRRSNPQQLLLFVLIVLTFGLDELAQYFLAPAVSVWMIF